MASTSAAKGTYTPHRRTKSYFESVDFKIGSKHRDMTPDKMGFAEKYDGPPMIDTKAFKLAFLKGDKDVVMYFEKNQAFPTSYQDTMKGHQVGSDRVAFCLDNQRTSFIGQVIPDPNSIRKFALRCCTTLQFL